MRIIILAKLWSLCAFQTHAQIEWNRKIEPTQGQKTFVYFATVTCTPCRYMEKYVFTDEAIVEWSQSYRMVKITNDYGDDKEAQQYWEDITKQYNIQYNPVFYLIDEEGHQIKVSGLPSRDPENFMIGIRHYEKLLAKK